jgi:hypothetical protein
VLFRANRGRLSTAWNDEKRICAPVQTSCLSLSPGDQQS